MLPSGASRNGEALDLSPSPHASHEARSAGDAQELSTPLHRGPGQSTSHTVESAVPHDLQGLASMLRGPLPGQPPVVDLQGRTLSGQLQGDLTFVQPGLILRNGILQLPPNACMDIRADGVQLQELTITRQAAGARANTVFINAQQVIIKDCKIKYEQTSQLLNSKHTAIHVMPGRSACLTGCVIAGSPGNAVAIIGPDCNVEVHNSHVHNNQGSGFHVEKAGGVLSIGAQCMAFKNGRAGFEASYGGKLIVGDGCKAVGNEYGFTALGQGTQVRAGQRCRAEGNTNHGFVSVNGAKMFVGERCEAISNGMSGFRCTSGIDAGGTQMVLGHGCRAVCNGSAGIVVAGAATIVAGQGCIASSNKQQGFIAMHEGSRMRVGANSKAVGNKKKGFCATQGGRLEVDEGCVGLD